MSSVHRLVADHLSLAEAGNLSRVNYTSREAMAEWHGDNRQIHSVPVMGDRFLHSIRAQVEHYFNENLFNGLLPFRCEVSQNHRGLPTLDLLVYFEHMRLPEYVLRMEIESEGRDLWNRRSNEPRWWLRVMFNLPNKNAILNLAFRDFNNFRAIVDPMTHVTFKPIDPHDDRGAFLKHSGLITHFRQGHPTTTDRYDNGIENEFLGLCGLLYGSA